MESPYIPTCWHFSRIFCSAHFGRLYLPNTFPPQERDNNNSRRWNRASTTKIRVCTPATGNPCTAQLLTTTKPPTSKRSNGFPPWKNQRNHLTVPLNNNPPPNKAGGLSFRTWHWEGKSSLDSPWIVAKDMSFQQTLSPNKIPSRGTNKNISHQNGFAAGKSSTQKYLEKLKRGYVIVPRRLL